MKSLMNLVDGIIEINDRVLTFCVVCGDPTHTLAEGTFDEGMVAAVNRGVEIMHEAMCRYPKHRRPRDMSTSSDPPRQSRENTGSMDVDGAESAASFGRRPKAKARPRRGETIASDLILIRYDTQHICWHEVKNRRGAFLICGVDVAEVGPDNNDKVIELIENMSDHRDCAFRNVEINQHMLRTHVRGTT